MPAPAPTRRSALQSAALPFLAPLLASGCSPALAGPARQETLPSSPTRLLLVTATAGYTHDSIPVARDVLTRLGQDSGAFEVTLLPDLSGLAGLTAQTLAAHDAVFFLNTSGELPLDGAQKGALLEFVAGGGGYLGAHAASDTFYTWPEYGDLVGAYFQEHPWTQAVRIIVEDETHPLTGGLGSGFSLTEEVYVFRSNPRPGRTSCCASIRPQSTPTGTSRFPGAPPSGRGAASTPPWDTSTRCGRMRWSKGICSTRCCGPPKDRPGQQHWWTVRVTSLRGTGLAAFAGAPRG